MSPLERIAIYRNNPPDGGFEVEYEDTSRPGRTVRDRYGPGDLVSVTDAARITCTPRRTLYNWINRDELEVELDEEGHYWIPMSEVRSLLGWE